MKRAPRDLALLCILLGPLALGAITESAEQNDSLDTVVVEGRLQHLEALRNEMVLIEDKFYEQYNAVNSAHDFDTHCYIESRTGTRTKSRYCRAVYQEKAFEREGQDYSEALKTMMNQGAESRDPAKASGGTAPMPWVPPTPSTVMIEARRKEYQQNIRNVVKSHPELIELLRQRYELGQRYEATRRSLFEPKTGEQNKGEPTTPVTP